MTLGSTHLLLMAHVPAAMRCGESEVVVLLLCVIRTMYELVFHHIPR